MTGSVWRGSSVPPLVCLAIAGLADCGVGGGLDSDGGGPATDAGPFFPTVDAPPDAGPADAGAVGTLPRIRFTPDPPASGQTVRVDITDGTPWTFVDLSATGPCGMVSGAWRGVDDNGDRTWTWHYDLAVPAGGTYEVAFTAEKGSRTVIRSSLLVSGSTDCGRFLYGIHSWSPGAAAAIMSGKRGWAVEILLVEDPNRAGPVHLARYDQIVAEGFEPITWLEYSWTAVPYWTAGCPAFASGSADAVRRLGNRSRVFVLGNETNLKYGRTREVTVDEYVSCYRAARSAIRAVRTDVQVLVQGVGPWNPETDCAGGPYDHTTERWKNYLHCIVRSLGDQADGYAIHGYGGRNGDRDPSDDGEWGFGVFETTLAILDGAHTAARARPVHLTEWNIHADGTWPAYDASWAGFINRAFDRLGRYNAANGGRIKSASYFTYDLAGWERTNLTRWPTALDDFRLATATTAYPSR